MIGGYLVEDAPPRQPLPQPIQNQQAISRIEWDYGGIKTRQSSPPSTSATERKRSQKSEVSQNARLVSDREWRGEKNPLLDSSTGRPKHGSRSPVSVRSQEAAREQWAACGVVEREDGDGVLFEEHLRRNKNDVEGRPGKPAVRVGPQQEGAKRWEEEEGAHADVTNGEQAGGGRRAGRGSASSGAAGTKRRLQKSAVQQNAGIVARQQWAECAVVDSANPAGGASDDMDPAQTGATGQSPTDQSLGLSPRHHHPKSPVKAGSYNPGSRSEAAQNASALSRVEFSHDGLPSDKRARNAPPNPTVANGHAVARAELRETKLGRRKPRDRSEVAKAQDAIAYAEFPRNADLSDRTTTCESWAGGEALGERFSGSGRRGGMRMGEPWLEEEGNHVAEVGDGVNVVWGGSVDAQVGGAE